jgi:hypothetical protein
MEDKIYAKDFTCHYRDKKGNPCGEQAVAFYPIFDIDQETKPQPYCQKHLDEMQLELIIAICEESRKNK